MRKYIYLFATIILCLGAWWYSDTDDVKAKEVPYLYGVSSRITDNAEYIIFSFSAPVKHQKIFTLDNPKRLVIDVSRIADSEKVKLPHGYKGKAISNIRFGHHDNNTDRIVFDLRRSIKLATVDYFHNAEIYKMVVRIEPEFSLSDIVPILKPDVPREKPIIVIDAGHGGKDPGTVSNRRIYEKHVTLDFAKKLAKELNNSGRYKAILTRDDDRFILLKKRVDIARKAKADIFISIHADSAHNDSARGLSVYTLSEKASDKAAAALAAKENSADEIEKVHITHDDEQVADILVELVQRDTKNKSMHLAEIMVRKLRSSGVKLLSNTHRFAGFRVLKTTDIPAVLVELGFLSNRKDASVIRSREFQRNTIRGIVAALDSYFRESQQ